jgi:phenylacetate-CoA ligase
MRFRRQDAAEKVNDRFWHEIEGMPLDEVRRIQEERLRAQMAYLKANSTFYQERFAEAGVDFDEIRTIEDLQKLPFTYKTEIRESLAAEPPFGKHRAAPMSDIIQMQASSGTTGSPSYVALTEADAEMWHEMTARCFFANGVRPGDMVLHAFSLAKGFVGGVPVMQGLQYMGAIDVPVGADGGVERLLRACADTRPRCIVGAPNFVLHLAEKAPEVLGCKATELGVERIIVGGEPGGGIPAIRAKIEEAWGAKCCEMLGGTDLGVTYWAECDDQSGMHMVNMDYIITELLEGCRGRDDLYCARPSGEPARAVPVGRLYRGPRHRVLLRAHRPQDPLHRTDRRHADRARGQCIPLRDQQRDHRDGAGHQRRHAYRGRFRRPYDAGRAEGDRRTRPRS